MKFPPRITSIAAAAALAAGLCAGGPALAGAAPSLAPSGAAATQAPAEVGKVCYQQLPSQAHDTLDLIEKGGPYPYPQDGTVFGNREGILPEQEQGYYHEYTVKTAGSDDRGARRIVTGEKRREDYYTADHYESFDTVDYGC